MKRLSAILLYVTLTVGLIGCGTKETASTPSSDPVVEATVEEGTEVATGKYSVYNATGDVVTELYLYETGSDKGENYAGNGFAGRDPIELTYEGTESTVLTIEYTTESGFTGKFETLHIEETPISLQVVDATSGATPISFCTLDEAIMGISPAEIIMEEPLKEGVEGSVKEGTLTNKGATFLYKNVFDSDLKFYQMYHIQKETDGVWDFVILKADIPWTMESVDIPVGEEVEEIIDWSEGYGELESGHYRLNKHFSSENFDSIETYIEFTIE